MIKPGDQVIYFEFSRGYGTKKHHGQVVKVFPRTNRVRIVMPDGSFKITLMDNVSRISSE